MRNFSFSKPTLSDKTLHCECRTRVDIAIGSHPTSACKQHQIDINTQSDTLLSSHSATCRRHGERQGKRYNTDTRYQFVNFVYFRLVCIAKP